MKRSLLAIALICGCKTAGNGAPASTSQNGAPASAGGAASRSQPAKAGAPSLREVPASALADVAGESVETAIAIPADAPNGGVDFENNWIFDRYGKFRRNAGGTGTQTGRRYDVVKIELPSGEKKTVYFDVTENWAHWSPP